MNQLEIKTVTYLEAIEPLQMIRCIVFQDEQGVNPELEFDGLDESAVHLLAYLDGEPVGTARIRKLEPQTAKIERVAVLSSARGFGIGTELVKTALELISRNKNYLKVVVNAQEYIKKLYEKLGFQSVGEPFDEAGIPHIKMIKYLEG
ncbi:GNAT family N-acetyltransferase [Aphanothece hegewaldii CCALA 016]|uniref:GNAT family N-acetyltransferase n=1 Tax=Aphanothece hegewaldii CCALA 016 TaxID=2107694 RepID=A0A2T1LZ10_9CHRO|nr:GNAT family N-acetyltransferase [Aphanothece hegewaldii]PSF37645.1 GNAT family N-acetyltransferase [Aphanothece hegewaldii CCALA 016]